MNESYYTKKKVLGDAPLKEVIYEIEEAMVYDSFLGIHYVKKDVLVDLIHRHSNTVNEFKKRLARLIN